MKKPKRYTYMPARYKVARKQKLSSLKVRELTKKFALKNQNRYKAARQRKARPKVTAGTKRAPKVRPGFKTNAKDWAASGAWVLVKSSNVRGISYAEETKQLFVEFLGKGGTDPIYVYYEVPVDIAKGMFNASSMGKYVHRKLKGFYRYSRIK